MGRKRKDSSLGLPPRVYLRHGAFYYVHPADGRWERIGTDIKEACKRGNHYNDPDGRYGSMAYWIDQFIVDCDRRVGLPKSRRGLSKRTRDDYTKAAEPLKAFFGRMLPADVKGYHVAQYLDAGAEADRPVSANREKACLSACFTWMMRDERTGVTANPCFGINRNPEFKRERYVEHHEFQVVYDHSPKMVRALMDLIYRTLQRPEDIIEWGPANLVQKREADGTVQRVIRNDQAKTGKIVDIRVSPEIDQILPGLAPDGALVGPGMPFIHTRKGTAYTYSGISSMFRRIVYSAYKRGLISAPFGFYDLKGKGATDMWLAGTKLTLIQVLCGHESVKTTEIYVKARWRGTVEPNQTALFAVQ